MSNLPRISGRDCSKILIKIGYYLKRQEGSHMIMRKDDPFSQVVVPDHDEIRTGTLRAIIRFIGFSVEEFKKLI
jgi:predicted RNA binding protein YcfA (HicA-like mRNA interferase family)